MSKKYRILSVHNFYRIRGGEDTVFANEKKLLEEHGHEVYTYTRYNNEISDFSFLRKLLLPLCALFSPRTYREIRSIIREREIDIVHVHNTLPLVSPSVYYAALSCGVPVVQHVHNYRLQCPEGNFFRNDGICEDCAVKGLHCALRHCCYRNSLVQTLISVLTIRMHRLLGIYRKLHYICMTPFTRDNLLAANTRSGKIIFDSAKVHIKPHFTYPARTETKKERRFYLFIGRLEGIKGIRLLIDAFAAMPNKELVLAGTGSEASIFIEEVRQRGLKNITFVGFCGRERLNELLAESKAVIVPSRYYEPFGMIIIEAFAAGVPVLAGDIGGFASIIENGVNGLLYRYDSPEALCATITRFEADTTTPWYAHAASTYEHRFSPEINHEQLIDIYRKARGLKVLISLTDQSFRATKSVGIYNVSIGLAKGLAQCEDVNELHILANKELEPLLTCLPPHVHIHFADKDVPVRYRRVWWDQIGISRAVREIQPDWALLPKGVPPFFPRMGKTKLACYVHDVNWEYYARLGKGTPNSLPRYQHLYFKWLLLRALRISDLIFTSTEFNRGRYLHYEPHARIEVVGIGFDGSQSPFRSRRGRDILFFSSPYPHKMTELGVQRVSDWLHSLGEEAKGIRVHVIGGQTPNFAFPDERWIPYGRIPETEMKRMLTEECRVGVYFSAYEGFGMPPVECLRAGIPCVASDLPPIRENIPPTLLFDNENADSFYHVMNEAYRLNECPNLPPYPRWDEVAQHIVSAMQTFTAH